MPRLENSVELLGYYGSDEVIACSAWTSTSRELTPEKRERIPKLIDMLWNNWHETPMEKGAVHFLVNVEQASHIHILKHRISNVNSESYRYKELKEDKYYLPEDWKDIEVSETTGSASAGTKWLEVLERYTQEGNALYHQCIKDLEPTLGRKRAKESARYFKNYNSQLQMDVMFNMRSFANFIKLRDSEHAQKEIREIAQKMWTLVENIEGKPFENTLKVIQKRIQMEKEAFGL